MNQDIILTIALPVTLFFIMFGMGSRLTPAHFLTLLETPGAVTTGIVSQMLMLPLLAFFILTPFQLSPELFAGFMILALSPGGTTSNMFSFLAGGNLALSIALTAIVSLASPFSIPLLAGSILDEQFGVDTVLKLSFLTTVLQLSVVTLLPVALGMLLQKYKPQFCDRHSTLITRIPLIMLLLVISGIIHQNWINMPTLIEQTAFPSLLLASLALLAGYLFARSVKLSTRDARTIAIETSIQNGGTAILVTGTILHNPAMTIAPVMYGILMLIPVFAYLLILNFKKPPVAA